MDVIVWGFRLIWRCEEKIWAKKVVYLDILVANCLLIRTCFAPNLPLSTSFLHTHEQTQSDTTYRIRHSHTHRYIRMLVFAGVFRYFVRDCRYLPVFSRDGWHLPEKAGFCHSFLVFAGDCRYLPEMAGICWRLLVFAGVSWYLPEIAGIYEKLLVFAGDCRYVPEFSCIWRRMLVFARAFRCLPEIAGNFRRLQGICRRFRVLPEIAYLLENAGIYPSFLVFVGDC